MIELTHLWLLYGCQKLNIVILRNVIYVDHLVVSFLLKNGHLRFHGRNTQTSFRLMP